MPLMVSVVFDGSHANTRAETVTNPSARDSTLLIASRLLKTGRPSTAERSWPASPRPPRSTERPCPHGSLVASRTPPRDRSRPPPDSPLIPRAPRLASSSAPLLLRAAVARQVQHNRTAPRLALGSLAPLKVARELASKRSELLDLLVDRPDPRLQPRRHAPAPPGGGRK